MNDEFILCAGWFWDFAPTYFCLREGGAERDDFDFLIFFAKKSKNQNHLSPPSFGRVFIGFFVPVFNL
jgi:hypothetical protein